MSLWINDEPVLWLGAGLILAGLAGVIVASAYDHSMPGIVLGHVSGISIGAGLVDLLLHFTMLKRLLRQVSEQVTHAIQLPLEDFYQGRHELPSLEQELKGASEIWLAWHIGSVQGSGTLNIGALPCERRRLLLTHPDSGQLDGLAKILGRSKDSMRSNIFELTRLATRCGIAVRWFDGPLSTSMVIVNPRDPEGWARLEFLMPYQRPTERPSLRVSKRRGQAAFKNAIDTYEQVWNNAVEAPLELALAAS